MNKELILGIFFTITGALMYWGTIVDFKERKEEWRNDSAPWHLRQHDSGQIWRLRIPAIAFLFVGLQFLYNELALIQGWKTTGELFTLFANWVY